MPEPRVPRSRGNGPPASGQGAQEAEEGGCWGRGRAGKAEKGQARRGYFNMINDRTPLRVCFNNQDTLQQVDRMFAVNLHMSSEQAMSINSVRENHVLQPLQVAPLAPGGCLSLLVSGSSGQRRTGVRAVWPGYFLSGEFPGLPTKIRAPYDLLRKTTAGMM